MKDYIAELLEKYPDIKCIEKDIREAYELIAGTYANGHFLLVGGNGGSAADAAHMTGELMKSMNVARPLDDDIRKKFADIGGNRGLVLGTALERAYPTIDITSSPVFTTAFANDQDSVNAFAQLVLGYGREGDTFLAISTSGNSENIIRAAIVAKAKGLKVIALTGKGGGELVKYADVSVIVPADNTPDVQERHLPIYHAWCKQIES